MKLIDRIARNYATADSHSKIEVPEWGESGSPQEIFYSPLTLAELSKITRFAGSDEILMTVYTLIFKALDAEGQPCFDLADKKILMEKANPAIAARVAKQILGDLRLAAGDGLK